MSRWADSLIEEEPAQYSLIFKLHPHFSTSKTTTKYLILGLKFFVVALAYTPMAETLSVVVHEKRNWLWGGFGKGPAPSPISG